MFYARGPGTAHTQGGLPAGVGWALGSRMLGEKLVCGRGTSHSAVPAHKSGSKALAQAGPSERGLGNRLSSTVSRGRSPVGTGSSQPLALRWPSC